MRRIFMALAIAPGLVGVPAAAGVIVDHAFSHADASTSNSATMSQQALGSLSSATPDLYNQSYITGIANSSGATYSRLVDADAAARVGGTASSLLGASASAYGEAVPIQYPPNYGAVATAYSAWTDIAYVANPQPPQAIDLTFSIEGKLSQTPSSLYPSDPGVATISAGGTGQVTDFTKGVSVPQTGGVSMGYTNNVSPGWTIQDGVVQGTLTVRAAYDPSLGGYGFTVELYTQATEHYGSAIVDFMDTLALTQVTTDDGTPLAASFDSGISLGATVPEPSSLILLGLGVAGFLAVGRRGRRRIPAPAIKSGS